MFDAEVSEEDIRQAIEELMAKYEKDEFSFQVYHIAKGYQFLTKPAYKASIGILLKQQSKKRLSTAALETLSIIAYKQPVTKAEIEQIRGVGCDYAVQKLLEKALIDIVGKDDTVGKPLLYGTSDQFMEYFGINSLDELPTLKDFAQDENTIGVDALDNGEESSSEESVDATEGEDTPENESENPSQPETDTEAALATEGENHTEIDDQPSLNDEIEPAHNEEETIQNEEGATEINEIAPKPEEVPEEDKALPEGDETTSEEKEDETEPEQTPSAEEEEVMPEEDDEPSENPENSSEEDGTEEDATKPGGL